MADARRAETYLRLLAETELRAALAFPRVEPPSDRLPTPLVWAGSAVGAVVGAAELVTRPVRPAAIRAGRAARPWAEGAAGFLAPPARVLASPARLLASPAGTAGRAVRMAGWRARAAASWIGSRWSDRNWQDTPSARSCLQRVQAAASALAITGALGAETARSVADNMERALALRHRIEDEGLLYAHLAAVGWHQHSSPAPAGPVRAVPIGATVGIEAHDEHARLHLLALVLAADQAIVTMVAQQAADRDEPADDEDDDEDLPDLYMIVDNLKVQGVDDRGGKYQVRMEAGGGSDWLWEGQFSVTPVPPPGIRWLEITVMRGQRPVRIDLPPASPADAEPAWAGRTPPSVADRAERVIDIASQSLLGGPDVAEAAEYLLPEVADQVLALQAVGALRHGSPALARLLTLAGLLDFRIPSLAAAAAAAGLGDEQPEDLLPEAWRAILELDDVTDGRTGLVPATAVLPELDGARCVVTGLRGEADDATVKMLAWGWPQTEWGRHEPGARQFRWLARDDTGRWHVGYENGGSYGEGATEFELTLTPPLHPAATSLELMLTGISGQVSVMIPLTWMATS